MTTAELTAAAANLALAAAAYAAPSEVEQQPDETDAEYTARMVCIGANLVDFRDEVSA